MDRSDWSGNKRVEGEERIVDRLRKIMELANRAGTEAEAQVAAEALQRMLTAHNLSIADLEKKGAKKPEIKKGGYDLGKAAFKWKLALAEAMAQHYYCYAIVDHTAKTVAFVGRPDNVAGLIMLYEWIINQIRDIASTERVKHHEETGEHIDPLRWQVNFGLGAVGRLRERLREMRDAQARDNKVNALVQSHNAEISDWMEAQYGYRIDGRPTKRMQEWQKEDERVRALKDTDIEAYYKLRPWERPEEVARRAKQQLLDEKREARNAARRVGPAYREQRRMTDEDHRKADEAHRARKKGHEAAEAVNLEPFIGDGKKKSKGNIGG